MPEKVAEPRPLDATIVVPDVRRTGEWSPECVRVGLEQIKAIAEATRDQARRADTT